MILLKGHTLERKSWFQPEAMALNLEERNSTATLTLGPEAPTIAINDWLKDDTDPGKGVIWRVKAVAESMETRTRTVNLEHVIQGLKDFVLFGETTPATITGKSGAKNCTAKQAMQYALKGQSEWKLGTVDVNPTNPYSFNGDNVYAALETVTGSIGGVQWEYDLGSVPFTLHIRKKKTGFQCEFRMSRNITTLKKQIDRSRMYTRIYPIGKNNLHIDGNYLSKNEKTWGTVCKVETDQSQDTKEKLKAWAQEKLDAHCEPLVTIMMSGLDLSAGTGEPLDKIAIGLRCRVPLPDFGTVLTEPVTKLSWSDKIKEPKKFTATLANIQEDVASIVNSLIKSGGGGGRAAAKNAEEDHAWFIDTTDKVGMVAEAVAGPGAKEDWSRVSSIIADGTGLHAKVTKTAKELVTAEARIDVTEKNIGLVVSDGKIKAASICLAINNGGSSATINADKIHLLGETIAEKISANYIKAKLEEITGAVIGSLVIKGTAQVQGHVYASGLHLGTPDGSYNVGYALVGGKIQPNGDNYKLIMYDFFGGEHTIGSFSRAVTLSGAWRNGTYTVTASPQGNEIKTSLGVAPARVTRSGNTLYVPVITGSGGDTGYNAWINVANNMNSVSLAQHKNATGQTTFTAYYLAPDGVSYVSMGYHSWYSSGSSVGNITAYY